MTKFEYLLQAFWASCHRFGEVILRNLLHLCHLIFMLGGNYESCHMFQSSPIVWILGLCWVLLFVKQLWAFYLCHHANRHIHHFAGTMKLFSVRFFLSWLKISLTSIYFLKHCWRGCSRHGLLNWWILLIVFHSCNMYNLHFSSTCHSTSCLMFVDYSIHIRTCP